MKIIRHPHITEGLALTPALVDAVQAAAEARRLSKAAWYREAIQEKLVREDPNYEGAQQP